MDYSDDTNSEPLAVNCYLDESATDGGTPSAVVGGLVLNSSQLDHLDIEWSAMLHDFDLSPGLHMKDFGLVL